MIAARHPMAFGPLSLGCANLGNLYREMDDEQADSVVAAAIDHGIRYFDTAPHYGLGLSERRLGRSLARLDRSSYVLSTKVGRVLVPNPGGENDLDDQGFAVPADHRRVFDFTESGIRRSLDDSLERLAVTHVDIVYLHDPEDDEHPQTAIATGLTALERLRDEGLVGAIGVGSKSVEILVASLERADLDLLMVAGRYTLLEQPALHDVLPRCAERGVGVVSAAVYNSGLLASSNPDAASHYQNGAVPREMLERALRLARECAAAGVDLPSAALQFPLRHPQVRTVVVGASSAAQIEENGRRISASIPEDFWSHLASAGLIPG